MLGTGLVYALGHRSDMDIGTVYAKRHHCVSPLPRIRSYCTKRWYSALNTFGGFVLIFLIGLSSTSGRESPRISWRVGRQCLSPTQKAKVSGSFGCRPTAYLLGPAALAHRSPVIDFGESTNLSVLYMCLRSHYRLFHWPTLDSNRLTVVMVPQRLAPGIA